MAYSSPTSPVSCTRRHTAVTFYVGTVTGAAAASASPIAVAVATQQGRGCVSKFRALESQRIYLSRAELIFYTPTAAQWQAGARWFRCDATLFTLNALANIPTNFLTVTRTIAGINAYRRCLTSTHALTSCALRHTHVARTYVTLAASTAAYPGPSATRSRSLTLCRRALGKAKVSYTTFPLVDGWSYGERTATCFVAGT
jgi:hypothetical protein